MSFTDRHAMGNTQRMKDTASFEAASAVNGINRQHVGGFRQSY